MALDFPANPVDGEIFGSYVYSASKGVWQSREESAAPAIMSPVKPLTGSNGDIWVNTNEGTAFAYYDDGTSGQWIELVNSLIPELQQTMPVASIIQTARASAPTGWLICDGTAVSRTTYSRLFSAIGTTYGNGDGSTTFGLPNLRGRIPVGLDPSQTEFDALGEVGGTKTHSLSSSEMPAHTHTFSGTTSGGGTHNHEIVGLAIQDSGSGARLVLQGDGNMVLYSGNTARFNTGGGSINSDQRQWQIGQSSDREPTTSNGDHSHTYSGTTSSTGSGSAHNNLQPYVVLNYMIKV